MPPFRSKETQVSTKVCDCIPEGSGDEGGSDRLGFGATAGVDTALGRGFVSIVETQVAYPALKPQVFAHYEGWYLMQSLGGDRRPPLRGTSVQLPVGNLQPIET